MKGWLVAVALLLAVPWASLMAQQDGDPVLAESLGVDLSTMERTGRGVYWRDLSPGTGAVARDGARVTIHYTGWLADGRQFDSSRGPGEPIVFRLGGGRVIRGWEDGLRGMRVGAVRQLVIPPRMAYGARGMPPLIPSNAMLVFEVELLDVVR